MRGNHRCLGRQDYKEPDPLSEEQRQKVASVTVVPVEGKKTFVAVVQESRLIGYVRTRCNQVYRTPEMAPDDWIFVASDWNRSDPPHGHAIVALLEHLSESQQ